MKRFWCKVNNLDSSFLKESFPFNVMAWPCENDNNKTWRLLILAEDKESVIKIINTLWRFNKIIEIIEKDNKWTPSAMLYPMQVTNKKFTLFHNQYLNKEV
jgi:hypothetical protein